MPASVIKLMCAFLYIAALKDFLMSWFIKRLLNNGPEPDDDTAHTFKIFEIMTCFIMEDLFQVWLQYFYFEKYRFEQTITFYVNAGNRSFSSEFYARSRLLRTSTSSPAGIFEGLVPVPNAATDFLVFEVGHL